MSPPAVLVRRDVLDQRRRDGKRAMDWPQWEARTAAVVAARKALAEGEHGAQWALRQALIDLAACNERIATTLPVPTVNLT